MRSARKSEKLQLVVVAMRGHPSKVAKILNQTTRISIWVDLQVRAEDTTHFTWEDLSITTMPSTTHPSILDVRSEAGKGFHVTKDLDRTSTAPTSQLRTAVVRSVEVVLNTTLTTNKEDVEETSEGDAICCEQS